MPSRINNTIWGSPSDWIYSNNSQQQCKMCKTYYPDIVYAHNELLNKFYDTSVSVWGVPYDCSVGRKTTVSWYADGDKNVVVEYTEPHLRTNVPLTILATSGATPNGNRYNRDPYVYNYYNCRIKDDVSLANRSFSETFPSGTRSATRQFMTTGGGTSPQYNLLSLQATYYDFRRNIHAINATVMPKSSFGRGSAFLVGNDLDTLISTTWDSLKTNYEYENDEDIVITGASYIVYSGLRMSLSDAVRADIQGSAFLYPQVSVEPSSRTKSIYYTANNGKVGDGIYQNVNHIGLGYISSGTLKYPNLATLPTATTYFNNKTTAYSSTNDVMSQCDNIFAISRKKQKFADVEYHWGVGLVYGGESLTGSFNLADIDNLSLSGITTNQEKFISMVPYLVIDDDKGNGYKMACKYALMHEYAFYGMPFTTSNSSAINSVWSNSTTDIYIPLFDENMVTTGDYVTLKKAYEQYLPQTVWTDLFNEQSIFNYDPEFQPEPTPSDDNDYGYLNNKATTNRVYSSNNRVYALTEPQYNQFIKDINSLYLNDADGFEKFQLDFKGTNPTDYIVGSYGYTFLPGGLITDQPAENIEIGAVTLPNAQGYRIAPAYIYNYKSLGTIDLTGAGLYTPFGDFRDFEPYTSIELYVPLCGNIKLDPSTVVGHTIQVEIRFDIMTGNATACVYRDNSTLIATIAGQLAANLPLSAGRMGDYQNAIKQSENALKQNELKTATAAATVAIGVGAALLAPETGGLSLAAYGAAVAGASSLMSLSNQKNEIEYEISHKQPSIAVCSAANGAVAQNISSMYAVCYVKQCKMLSTYNAETYAHTIGHACIINSTIADQVTLGKNSFIKCGNVDLSGISATASEISAIQSLLTSGIYV